MDRKYWTNHQGIAAYMCTKGFTLLRVFEGKNKKTQRPTVTFEFDCSFEDGKSIGDEFYEGNGYGNLKAFYDQLLSVRQQAWQAKGGQRNV